MAFDPWGDGIDHEHYIGLGKVVLDMVDKTHRVIGGKNVVGRTDFDCFDGVFGGEASGRLAEPAVAVGAL